MELLAAGVVMVAVALICVGVPILALAVSATFVASVGAVIAALWMRWFDSPSAAGGALVAAALPALLLIPRAPEAPTDLASLQRELVPIVVVGVALAAGAAFAVQRWSVPFRPLPPGWRAVSPAMASFSVIAALLLCAPVPPSPLRTAALALLVLPALAGWQVWPLAAVDAGLLLGGVAALGIDGALALVIVRGALVDAALVRLRAEVACDEAGARWRIWWSGRPGRWRRIGRDVLAPRVLGYGRGRRLSLGNGVSLPVAGAPPWRLDPEVERLRHHAAALHAHLEPDAGQGRRRLERLIGGLQTRSPRCPSPAAPPSPAP